MRSKPKQWPVQETKLIPPMKHGGLIERSRLITRALAGAQGRLLLIVGAAGFGKTSVLVQLHQELSRLRRFVGWISLDGADNDHARFLCHLVEVFRQFDPRFGAVIATFLHSGAPLPPATLRTSLLNELAAIDRDVFLFLDDYHVIVDAEVRETVSALLMAPLARVHLLIASRSRNELPTSRLRALGNLSEIDGAELAFSEDETRDLLSKSCRQALDPSQIAQLHARTEGWAASLQLASIALDSTADVPRFLEDFSGETRSVGDFLADEVLRRQTPDLQNFLMDTSIFQRFNTELANRVTCRENAGELLGEIESRNLFVFALDDHRNWYRYHHLFADFLRRRLHDRFPDRVPELHRKAADWLTANGLDSEAIEHAFLAGDEARAGQLLDDACVQLFASGQIGTLQRHAARLRLATLQELPRLQLELSWDYEIQWRFEDARAILTSVRRSLEVQDQKSEPLPPCEQAFLESKLVHREMMLEMFTDRYPEAMALCRKWQANTPSDDPFMRASVGTAMMMIERERYQCDGAAPKADSLRALFLEGGAIYGTIFHDSAAGTTLFMRGDVDGAERTFEQARRCAVKLAGEHSSVAAMPTALLADLCYERGELVRAGQLIGEHSSSAAEFGFLDHAIARFLTASRLAFLDGRIDDAESSLEAGEHLAATHDFPRLHTHLLAERVRQRIALGEGRAAAALLAHPRYAKWMSSPEPGEDPTTTDEMFAIAWARLSVDRGEHAQVFPVLKRWLAHARQHRCHRSAVRLSAVLAHAYASSANSNIARRIVQETLSLVPKGGFVRSFVDEGPALAEVMADLHAGTPDSVAEIKRNIARILNAFGRDFPARCNQPVAGAGIAVDKSDKLSGREMEMIRLSAQGMATCDISRATSLSENTVKWYWKRIFAKLGVHRRFDAVKLARRHQWMT